MITLLTIPGGGQTAETLTPAERDRIEADVVLKLKFLLLFTNGIQISASELLGNWGFYRLLKEVATEEIVALLSEGFIRPLYYQNETGFEALMHALPRIREGTPSRPRTISHLFPSEEEAHANLIAKYARFPQAMGSEPAMRAKYVSRLETGFADIQNSDIPEHFKKCAREAKARSEGRRDYMLSEVYQWIELASQGDRNVSQRLNKYFKYLQSSVNALHMGCSYGYDSHPIKFSAMAKATNYGPEDLSARTSRINNLIQWHSRELAKIPLKDLIRIRNDDSIVYLRYLFAHSPTASKQFASLGTRTYSKLQNSRSLSKIITASKLSAPLIAALPLNSLISISSATLTCVAELAAPIQNRYCAQSQFLALHENFEPVVNAVAAGILRD